MNSEILAVGGATTIKAEEYRRLAENNAYLNVILSCARDPKIYILSDIIRVVDGLMEKDMGGEKMPQENTPDEEGGTEEAAHAE